MRRLAGIGRADTRGVAALEFALVLPVFTLMMGVVADFSLALWNKGLLASSVAQGAQYAMLTGPTVSTADVRSIVQQRLALAAAAVTVSAPACYCVSGTPSAATVRTCGSACPDLTMPGKYMTISASYTYKPVMLAYAPLTDQPFTQTTMLRLK